MNKTKNIIAIILSILFIAILGSIFVGFGMNWFNALIKPNQWIPNFVIPIMWSIIYLSFAVVLIIWQSEKKFPMLLKVLLIINGVLNVLWCLIFFTLKQTLGGEIIIVLNLIAGWMLINEIKKENWLCCLLLIIYPIWLSLATGLNTALWILN